MIRFTTVAVLVTAFAPGAGAQQPVAKRRPLMFRSNIYTSTWPLANVA
mgnify:CR=1 FL=1